MDIAAMSTGLSQMKMANEVGAAMLLNIKDVMQQQGEGLQQLLETANVQKMENSVSPHIGASIDIRV